MSARRASPVWLAGVLGLAGLIGWLRELRHPKRRLAGVDPEDLEARHETSDMSVGAIMTFGFFLLTGIVAAGAVVSGVMLWRGGLPAHLGRPLGGLDDTASVSAFPEPRLESKRGQELRDLRAREQQELNSYRWQDRSNGVVAIPIDRAMDIIATRGLPTRPIATPQPFSDEATGLPSRASSGRVVEAGSR